MIGSRDHQPLLVGNAAGFGLMQKRLTTLFVGCGNLFGRCESWPFRGYSHPMATRYVLQRDDDDRCSVIDIFTGQPAEYAGRRLHRIAFGVAASGVFVLNEIDAFRRGLWGDVAGASHADLTLGDAHG